MSVLEVLSHIKDNIVRDEYAKEIADRLEIDFKRVVEKLNEQNKTADKKPSKYALKKKKKKKRLQKNWLQAKKLM